MTLSPNRRYIAVADRGERPVIHIYDITTAKRKKTLTVNEVSNDSFKL